MEQAERCQSDLGQAGLSLFREALIVAARRWTLLLEFELRVLPRWPNCPPWGAMRARDKDLCEIWETASAGHSCLVWWSLISISMWQWLDGSIHYTLGSGSKLNRSPRAPIVHHSALVRVQLINLPSHMTMLMMKMIIDYPQKTEMLMRMMWQAAVSPRV